MKKRWIKEPFPLDLVSDTMIFDVHAHLERGKGRKVTIPTFLLKSPIWPEVVYQLDCIVRYYHPPERKGKRKRVSP